MIHGRFQPFHNGHLEYLRGAAARSEAVFVGITNPDPRRVKEEPSDPMRHLPESNPFTYTERLLMIEAVATDENIPVFDQICRSLRDEQQNPEWKYVLEGPEWRGKRVLRW